MKISVSIVVYHQKIAMLLKVIASVLSSPKVKILYLVDNSSTQEISKICTDKRIEYIHTGANLGYGKAHNIAIRKSILSNMEYHLVINPDIYFNTGVIEHIEQYMKRHEDIGLIMPNVLYPNGEMQYLCKLLPTPFDLFGRRFLPSFLTKKRNEKYELKYTGYNKTMNIPYLSGCFMFMRVKALKEVGIFDEHFFMYLEDTDLSRRIHEKYKTIFYPEVTIYHQYQKESYKNIKLLMHHIKSAIYYFNKWGWFFDKKRKQINHKTLVTFSTCKSNKHII